jgi:hypothetical protein
MTCPHRAQGRRAKAHQVPAVDCLEALGEEYTGPHWVKLTQ